MRAPSPALRAHSGPHIPEVSLRTHLHRQVFVGLVCCLLFGPAARGDTLPELSPARCGMSERRLAAIDRIVADGIARKNMPGAVVVVGRREGIVFRKAYGLRQVEPTPEPMTLDTVFDLASLTKPLATGLATMRLVQDGKLDLDAR